MTATLTRPAALSVDTLTMTEPDSLPESMTDVLVATICDARSLDPNTYRPRSQEWHAAHRGRALRDLSRRRPDRRNLQRLSQPDDVSVYVLR